MKNPRFKKFIPSNSSQNFHFLSFFIFCSTFVFAGLTQAVTNPQIRICQQLGGTFHVSQLVDYYSNSDQLGLCQIDESFIGSLDLLYYLNKNIKPESISELLNHQKKCTGKIIQTKTLEGLKIEICQYSDKSAVDLKTLNLGLSANQNLKLDSILKP